MQNFQTIPQLALRAARNWGASEAVIDAGQRITFSELADRMRKAGAAFIEAGLLPGERVSLWAPNSLEWIVAALGIHAAGGILVPLNTRFRGAEAHHILMAAKVSMLVVIDRFLDHDYAAMLTGFDAPHLRRVIRLGSAGPLGFDAFLNAVSPRSLELLEQRIGAVGEDDISDIMFTSGTTGQPKGAVTTHAQTVSTSGIWCRAVGLTTTDRFLILWPFFHCGGYKSGWLACLSVGACALPAATLEVRELVDQVEREKVTFLPGPPTLFNSLLSSTDLDVNRLRSVRVSITGASAVSPTLITAMRKTLKIGTVLTGYGLTETCGTLTMTTPADSAEIVVTSCGKAIEGVEIKIVDDAGKEVPTGAEGEIMARGANIMQGYLDDPKATALAIEPTGWLHTGDVGTLDAEGYLRITDRRKDMFIVGGFNCYPAEIEKMLMAHPEIAQVAVIGVPDSRMGEVGKAFVVLKQGATLHSESLIAWARERMANFKVPRQVEFVADLPTTLTGKIQKFKLV